MGGYAGVAPPLVVKIVSPISVLTVSPDPCGGSFFLMDTQKMCLDSHCYTENNFNRDDKNAMLTMRKRNTRKKMEDVQENTIIYSIYRESSLNLEIKFHVSKYNCFEVTLILFCALHHILHYHNQYFSVLILVINGRNMKNNPGHRANSHIKLRDFTVMCVT